MTLSDQELPTPKMMPSRYSSDFEQIAAVGSGAMGSVFQVKHRVDDCQYAIKVVKLAGSETEQDSLPSDSYNQRMLREVKTLSKLHHTHVVRYFQAWIENSTTLETMLAERTNTGNPQGSGNDTPADVDDELRGDSVYGQMAHFSPVDGDSGAPEFVDRSKDLLSAELRPVYEGDSIDSGPPEFTSSPLDRSRAEGLLGVSGASGSAPAAVVEGVAAINPANTTGAGAAFAPPVTSTDATPRSLGETPRSEATPRTENSYVTANGDIDAERVGASSNETAAAAAVAAGDVGVDNDWLSDNTELLLFIQMEFCERTLRDLINANEIGTEEKMWKTFREIVHGLDYIHSQGIMHRDLKPSNIFVAENGETKIGDFGLAKESVSDDITRQSLRAKTRGVGSYFYASPEIGGHYDKRTDLWSLGVVLYEMCCDFETQDDRIRALHELRSRHASGVPKFVPHFESKHPVAAKFVRALLARDPTERPSTRRLLRTLPGTEVTKVEDPHALVAQLHEQLDERDDAITKLESTLSLRDATIRDMKFAHVALQDERDAATAEVRALERANTMMEIKLAKMESKLEKALAAVAAATAATDASKSLPAAAT